MDPLGPTTRSEELEPPRVRRQMLEHVAAWFGGGSGHIERLYLPFALFLNVLVTVLAVA